jgi:ATP:ADP antiporter, AAA family
VTSLQSWITKAAPATPQERAAALWSFGYFFTLLAGYYVLRPLRDQMGIAGGVKALPWMFTATFVTLLVAQPLYGALVSRVPRAHELNRRLKSARGTPAIASPKAALSKTVFHGSRPKC